MFNTSRNMLFKSSIKSHEDWTKKQVKKVFTKARQLARHLRTDSSTITQQIAIYQGLMRLNRYYLSRYLSRL